MRADTATAIAIARQKARECEGGKSHMLAYADATCRFCASPCVEESTRRQQQRNRHNATVVPHTPKTKCKCKPKVSTAQSKFNGKMKGVFTLVSLIAGGILAILFYLSYPHVRISTWPADPYFLSVMAIIFGFILGVVVLCLDTAGYRSERARLSFALVGLIAVGVSLATVVYLLPTPALPPAQAYAAKYCSADTYALKDYCESETVANMEDEVVAPPVYFLTTVENNRFYHGSKVHIHTTNTDDSIVSYRVSLLGIWAPSVCHALHTSDIGRAQDQVLFEGLSVWLEINWDLSEKNEYITYTTTRRVGGRFSTTREEVERTRFEHGLTYAYVWLADPRKDNTCPREHLVNAILIERGLATVSAKEIQSEHSELFHELEKHARESGRGLWRFTNILEVSHD